MNEQNLSELFENRLCDVYLEGSAVNDVRVKAHDVGIICIEEDGTTYLVPWKRIKYIKVMPKKK